VHALLRRLGRRCARSHWTVIAAWLVILSGLLLSRAAFGGQFANDYTVPGSQSQAGADVLTATFPQQSGRSGQVVFATRDGTPLPPAPVNQSVANVARLPHVIGTVSPFATTPSPLVDPAGDIAYATVNFDVVPNTLDQAYLDQLDAAVAPARTAGLQVEYGGGAGQIAQQADDTPSEVIGLICALLLLVFMFGSIVAAALPLLSAVFSVLAGLSLLSLLAAAFTFPTAAPTVATLLGLGVAIDYGLFLVARYRERLDAGGDPIGAAAEANATSGSAIVVAGTTVVIAILGLFVAGVPFISALGVAAAIVVAVTMLAALTLVPAFLGVARSSVRSLAARRRERRGDRGPAPLDHEDNAFARWGRRVSETPVPWAIGAIVLLAVLTVPLFFIQFGQIDAGTDPTSRSSRRAYDLIAEGFGPGANGPLTVVLSVPAGPDPPPTPALLADTRTTLSAVPGVASVSPPQTNPAGDTAVLTVIPTTGPQDPATTALVNQLRDTVLPTIPATTYLTGTTAGFVDFTARTVQRLPILIAVVVLLSMLLLTAAFRSLAIGLKAAAMNLASVGAAYGVVVAVFQWGWGSALVGIDQPVPIPAFVPMLMFAIIFGLSMDYEVFLISRVHESYQDNHDPHRSVAIGIGGTARVITTAAAVMVVVFISFVADPDPTVKMLAVGMAISVLIDASLVRMILVPAVMALLGRRAWWIPRWLDRILPNLDISD